MQRRSGPYWAEIPGVRVCRGDQYPAAMNSVNVCLLVFASTVGGVIVGSMIRARLPGHHIKDDSRDVIKTASGMIGTLVALVLGLLVASAKGTFDTASAGINQGAARIVMLNRALVHYGPEAVAVRTTLHQGLAARIAEVWPESGAAVKGAGKADLSKMGGLDLLEDEVRALAPKSDEQRYWQQEALKLAQELVVSRWSVFMQAQSVLPTAFLGVLIFWLAALYASLGMLAPRNATAWAAMVVCAVSISGALFLVLEMNRPLDGFIKVSDVPLQKALEIIGR